jgi:hypothetical protein
MSGPIHERPGAILIRWQARADGGGKMPSDWKKDMKDLYFPPTGKVVEVQVPALDYLVVEGHGDPKSNQGFQVAVEALYSMSYMLKFMVKRKAPAKDFKVGPLEALWWNMDDGSLLQGKKDEWQWKAMILQPSFMDGALVEEARKEVRKKRLNPLIEEARLERIEEGWSAQIMHIGPWDKETESIERIKDFIRGKGCTPSGHHHEIYLSDPRRVPPERYKTIIRQPFR